MAETNVNSDNIQSFLSFFKQESLIFFEIKSGDREL